MPTHVWFVQLTAVAQFPVVESHDCCDEVLAHCVCPGAQTPWHEDPTPVPTHDWFVQFTGVAQVPVELHDCSAAALEHSDCPGAHTPWHEAVLPLTRHVLLVHVCGVPHAPDALQVDTPLLVHSVAPGVHTPWHEAVLPLATHAWLLQLAAGPQLPVPSHVCTAALPEHCVAPGVQDPVHTPPVQAALPHATGFPHAPVALQVSTPLLLHCVDRASTTPCRRRPRTPCSRTSMPGPRSRSCCTWTHR